MRSIPSVFYAAIATVALSCRGPATVSNAESSLEAFEARPGSSTWNRFETDARARNYGAALAAVAEFYRAANQRDFPNSMALDGQTPCRKGIARKQAVLAAFGAVKANRSELVWKLIEKMAIAGGQKGDEDDEVARAGLELAARLSSDRFEVLSTQVLRSKPESKRTVEAIRWDLSHPPQFDCQ